MTEPQVWAALGILLAFLTATLTIVTRTISVQVGSLRGEMGSQFGGMHAEMNARFEGMHNKFDTRFDRVQDQLTTLDHDVQTLANRVLGVDRP